MVNANYNTSANPSLKITCHNDLVVSGATDNTVLISINDDSPASRIERHEEEIIVTAMDDCSITCPLGSILSIEHVSGDLRVTQVKGQATVKTIAGRITKGVIVTVFPDGGDKYLEDRYWEVP